MMENANNSKLGNVVICGGGVMGASIAYYLSLRGVKSTIIERCGVACAASGKAGGFLAFDWNDSGPLKQLSRKSFQLHAELANTLGVDCGYRALDAFSISATEAKPKKKYEDNSSFPQWINKEHITYSEQLGNTSTTAQVHPRLFTEALMQTALKNGATLKIGVVEGVEISEKKIKGVKVDGKLVPADIVIIAMGPWSFQAGNWFSLPIPEIGHKAHSITMRPKETLLSPHAFFVYFKMENGKSLEPEFYPRKDGELYICGGSVSTKLPEDPSTIQPNMKEIEDIRKIASAVAPFTKECELEKQQSCFLPISPDGKPLIGKIPNIEGAYICTGHSCWGILNGPASGFAIAQLIVDGKSEIDLSPFDPNRLIK